jgi:hypothetical protein
MRLSRMREVAAQIKGWNVGSREAKCKWHRNQLAENKCYGIGFKNDGGNILFCEISLWNPPISRSYYNKANTHCNAKNVDQRIKAVDCQKATFNLGQWWGRKIHLVDGWQIKGRKNWSVKELRFSYNFCVTCLPFTMIMRMRANANVQIFMVWTVPIWGWENGNIIPTCELFTTSIMNYRKMEISAGRTMKLFIYRLYHELQKKNQTDFILWPKSLKESPESTRIQF